MNYTTKKAMAIITAAFVYLAGNTERIAMDCRCDRNNDDRSKIPVEFIRAYHYAGTNLLYLSTDRRVEVNQ